MKLLASISALYFCLQGALCAFQGFGLVALGHELARLDAGASTHVAPMAPGHCGRAGSSSARVPFGASLPMRDPGGMPPPDCEDHCNLLAQALSSTGSDVSAPAVQAFGPPAAPAAVPVALATLRTSTCDRAPPGTKNLLVQHCTFLL
jgi:hypothetical protein